MKITNLRELGERREVKLWDTVYFGNFRYNVEKTYLEVRNFSQGDAIFKYLGLSDEEIFELADSSYGYKSGRTGYWPYYKLNDFCAAKRLIVEVYKSLEDKREKERIKNRFSILDIR